MFLRGVSRVETNKKKRYLCQMSKKKSKRKEGVVFSTNNDYNYSYEEEIEEETLAPNQQSLTVLLDRKQRKGKSVTLVTGFTGTTEDLKELGKTIKTKCGVGGTVKDGEIIIQGDFVIKTIEILHNLNYKAKRSGG